MSVGLRLCWVVLVFLFATTTQALEESAGFVLVVKGSAKAVDQNNAQTRPLKRQSEVFEQDIIETSQNGFVIIGFRFY